MELPKILKDKILEIDKRFAVMNIVLNDVMQGQAELRMIHTKKQMCANMHKDDIFIGCARTADECLLYGDWQCCIHTPQSNL